MATKRTSPASTQPKTTSPALANSGSRPNPPAPAKASKAAAGILAEPRVTLPGSERAALPPSDIKATAAKPPRAKRGPITVSVLVRRRSPLDPSAFAQPGAPRLSRAQFRRQHGADPAAVKAVRAFAAAFGLTVSATPEQLEARTLHLTGTRDQLQQAFGASLDDQTHGERIYRVRQGAISIPESLQGQIEAVLGLDDRPQAKPHFRIARGIRPSAAAGSSFTPPQIAQLYQFPANASAAGQTIALIELGGGYKTADISAYFKSLGLAAPKVVAVPVDGGKNAPSTPDGADGEVMLDIEVAAAVAPGSKIAVYFAPNTDQGFIDAVSTAVHDSANTPSVISISWGGPESSWTAQATTALDSACQAAAALGISITVAAGDNGSTDGVTDGANHVDFPASSPHVLACGGTRITASGATLTNEVVWNELSANEGATGGGVSTLFPLPFWQANANVPTAGVTANRRRKSPKPAPSPSPSAAGGRGVPDVAGNADPVTGYTIRVDGQTSVIGGTSAVAPLWAGLIALANAQNKRSAGFLNPTLYTNPAAFRDITSGNNGAFAAAPGWDACTGLGSPIGTAIVSALTGNTSPTKSKRKPTSAKRVH